jgi:Reverse transcriptase (RNA-dependent DNA polymerase)/Endonuclease-reverse transcriptase
MAVKGHVQINNTKKNSSCLLFKQINLNKSKVASADFAKRLVGWSQCSLIAFLQEPATTTKGLLESIPPGAQRYAALKPRAAIVATKEVSLWPLPAEYTSPDVVACLWKTGDERFPEVVLISVYADITTAPISLELANVVNYCGRRNLPCIIGADTNAHSVLWGCSLNNPRGDDYEAFAAANDLAILNVGNVPTFKTARAESIIDVTLVHYTLYDYMDGWHVSMDDYKSDHRCISFQLNIKPLQIQPVKNERWIDWARVTSTLIHQNSTWLIPEHWSEAKLDSEVELYSTMIRSVVDKCTPTFTPHLRLRKNVWWNDDLSAQRKVVRQAYKLWLETGSGECHRSYVDARRAMQSILRRAKVKSWQTFCSEAGSFQEGTSKALSRLNQILQRKTNQTLGLLRKPDQVMAESPEESIDLLLNEHFPESVSVGDLPKPQTYVYSKDWSEYPWLSEDNIRRALHQFLPYKTPGVDNIKPIVLQHLPPGCVSRLKMLYIASMELKYVPKLWRMSKAIFIPKPGKDDYAQPRSWRPISLMSFIFKTLERLILWHLEETVLKENSIHKNQHAFRKGRSTESALSDVVDHLESYALNKGTAIGVFLDIEGAFDNLLPEGVIRSLQQRNTPEPLLEWLRKYLVSRFVAVDYKGVQKTRKLVKGTLQGGVLSPVLWNLAFDEVLSLVDGTAIKAFGYADDLALVGRGPDLHTNIMQIQQVLDRVTAWGNSQGLKFSPSKSVAVAFTRKREPKDLELKLNGTLLSWSRTVKYLGVTLDSRLTWVPHFNEKTKNAKKLLFKYKQIVGTQFGPQPKYMRWMYLGIVRPALMYGAIIWWRCVSTSQERQNTLTRINRLALLTFGSIRRSSPTIALEAMGYVPPLDLALEAEAIKAWLRIRDIRSTEVWDGIGTGSYRGHRHDLKKLTQEYSIPEYVLDDIPDHNKWTRKYKTDPITESGTPISAPTVCFTAGTKRDDKAGAGFYIKSRALPPAEEAYPMGRASSHFQAEIIAIMRAAEMLLQYASQGQIIIHTGSQAALKALEKPSFNSKTVLATSMALDTLARASTTSVVLSWSKPNLKHEGIVKAISLAKHATTLDPEEEEPVTPIPKSFVKTYINSVIDRRWNVRWTSASTARQSRTLWPSIDKERSQLLLRSDRIEYGLLIRLFTGHNNMNYHRNLTKETDDDTCRLCQEEEESSVHVLLHCIDIAQIRHKYTGYSTLGEPGQLARIPLDYVRRLNSVICQRLSEEGLEKM